MRSELSAPWTQPCPRSAVDAAQDLDSLEKQCNVSERGLRDQAFSKARRFVHGAQCAGGASAPVSVKFQNRKLPPNNDDARVDIEVKTGLAFV
jgi:hypothetical protein